MFSRQRRIKEAQNTLAYDEEQMNVFLEKKK